MDELYLCERIFLQSCVQSYCFQKGKSEDADNKLIQRSFKI